QELGYGWVDGVHPADRASALVDYQDALAVPRPFSIDYRLRRADGEYRFVRAAGVPQWTAQGAFDGYIGSCVDVTEQREAADLRESLWKLHIADVAAFRELTADLRRDRRPQIGHEIRLIDGRVLDRDYMPVTAPDGTIAHMWHYRDVTVRRQLEARLRESSRRL